MVDIPTPACSPQEAERWQTFLDKLKTGSFKYTPQQVTTLQYVLPFVFAMRSDLGLPTVYCSENAFLQVEWMTPTHTVWVTVHPDGRSEFFVRDVQTNLYGGLAVTGQDFNDFPD